MFSMVQYIVKEVFNLAVILTAISMAICAMFIFYTMVNNIINESDEYHKECKLQIEQEVKNA